MRTATPSRRPNSKPTTCLRAPERVSSAGTLSSSTQATRRRGGYLVGQVSACSHKHQNTEWITEISATAAMDQWLNSKVSKTYAKGSTAKEIVSDLLNIFGVEIGDFSLATNKVYDRGLVCNGKVKDELKRIVVNDCKSRFLIRNGSVFINDPTKGIANGLVLTPQSGLLLSGNEVEETVIAVGSDSQKSSATKSGEGNYVTRECLLNYHIGPAEQVVIQSHSLNGRFIVCQGEAHRHTERQLENHHRNETGVKEGPYHAETKPKASL